jgi:hypothetical protein
MLANEAVRIAKTWKFAKSVTAVDVQTSFYFQSEPRGLTESQNPRLEMELPGWIRVRAVAANGKGHGEWLRLAGTTRATGPPDVHRSVAPPK